MTTLDQLVADHTILIQKIIAEAKNEALADAAKPKITITNPAGTSGNPAGTSGQTKLDLFSHISYKFDDLIDKNKEKNILTLR